MDGGIALNPFLTIKELLEAKEGEKIQFKEAKNRFSFEDAAKCCCALSNCGGGLLVFGITDKRPRKVVGSNAFEQPERTRMGLIEKIKVQVDFQILEDRGMRVLVFAVSSRPLGLPVQVDGVAWCYEGDALMPMPEKMRRQIYAESGFDFSGSICQKARMDDLDEAAIEAFRKKWMEKRRNQRVMNLSKEQLLYDCGAVTDEGVTYAALALFGKESSLRKYLPQAEIVFEYRTSNASGPASAREEFRCGFFTCFDNLWELINLRNEQQHYQEGFFVYDIPVFNEQIIREAILNAVSHRNYQMVGSIFIRQYRDRLVVESPGGFPNGINLDNILNRQAPRNRRIAEILALCGLVERSGQGMNLMYEMSVREAKALPDFTGTDEYGVNLILRGQVLDVDMLSVMNEIGKEQMDALSTEDILVIYDLYYEKPVPRELRFCLARLMELGIVERIERNRYVLAKSVYAAIGKSKAYSHITKADRDENKEVLLQIIRKNGEKGTPFRELQSALPKYSRSQMKSLLNEMREDGLIYCEGMTSAARWHSIDKA